MEARLGMVAPPATGPVPVGSRVRVPGTPLEFSVFLEPPGPHQDPISRELAASGDVSSCLAALMLALTRPGCRILDLGAHLGSIALVAAAAGCHVAAVDASPRNVE